MKPKLTVRLEKADANLFIILTSSSQAADESPPRYPTSPTTYKTNILCCCGAYATKVWVMI